MDFVLGMLSQMLMRHANGGIQKKLTIGSKVEYEHIGDMNIVIVDKDCYLKLQNRIQQRKGSKNRTINRDGQKKKTNMQRMRLKEVDRNVGVKKNNHKIRGFNRSTKQYP